MPIRAIMLLAALAVAGCAGVDVSTYRAEQPALSLEDYFDGKVDGWGMFQQRDGEVVRRFKVEIDASWSGNEGVLDEHFSYSDGTTERRVWTIVRISEHEYEGRADDVIGVARGRVAGNALHWIYKLRLPVDDEIYEVDFDDWMYLQQDDVLINRSEMTYFGFGLGELTLFFRKRS